MKVFDNELTKFCHSYTWLLGEPLHVQRGFMSIFDILWCALMLFAMTPGNQWALKTPRWPSKTTDEPPMFNKYSSQL